MTSRECPLISVVLPIYNGEKYLARCLDSLVRQDYPQLEFVVVDDGSTDGTPQLLRQYAARDVRFRLVRQENAGQSVARNRGIALSKGEFVGFVDADDYVEPALFSRLYEALQREGADIACCAYWTEGVERRLESLPDEVLTMEEAYAELVDNRILKHFLWNKLFRRAVLEGVRMPEGCIFEDVVFLVRCLARCHKFVLLSQPLYHYCENSESSSRTLSLDKRFQYVLATHEEQLFGMERHILPRCHRARILKRCIHLVNRLLVAGDTPETSDLLRRTFDIMHCYDSLPGLSLSLRLRRALLYRHLGAYRRVYCFFRRLRKKKG